MVSKMMRESNNAMKRLNRRLPANQGFECYRFTVKSYNELVDEKYKLNYGDRNMAVVVLNTPSFLETTFKSWLQAKSEGKGVEKLIEKYGENPMQAYFLEKFKEVKQFLIKCCALHCVDIVQDFDLDCSSGSFEKKPEVLLTTCGMVAGAAHFYRPSEENAVSVDPITHVEKRRMGLSLHPKYGGHFGFRAVLIFHHIFLDKDFEVDPAPILLESVQEQQAAIDLFNDHWKDGRFRDCGNPVERYSDLQLEYFNTAPMERWALIAHWFEEESTIHTANSLDEVQESLVVSEKATTCREVLAPVREEEVVVTAVREEEVVVTAVREEEVVVIPVPEEEVVVNPIHEEEIGLVEILSSVIPSRENQGSVIVDDFLALVIPDNENQCSVIVEEFLGPLVPDKENLA